MKNTYIFIVNTEGKRQATYLVQKESEIEALRRKAATEYPDCINFVGHDSPDFDAFAAGKLYVDGKYVDPAPYVPPLADVKAAKIAELKSIRNTKELEPVMYNGHRFDFDKDSIDRLHAATVTMNIKKVTTINWTSADQEEIPMTVDDLQGVIAAGGMRSNELHVIYRGLKERVNEATTNAEVEAIGWPEA